MSATELIVERSRRLTEAQAEAVLEYMDQLTGASMLTAKDLMNLPPSVRRQVLAQQAARAGEIYRNQPDLVAEDNEPPLEHE
jgi:hypothetical protein